MKENLTMAEEKKIKATPEVKKEVKKEKSTTTAKKTVRRKKPAVPAKAKDKPKDPKEKEDNEVVKEESGVDPAKQVQQDKPTPQPVI